MQAKGFVSSFDVGIDAGDNWVAAITVHRGYEVGESKPSSLIDPILRCRPFTRSIPYIKIHKLKVLLAVH